MVNISKSVSCARCRLLMMATIACMRRPVTLGTRRGVINNLDVVSLRLRAEESAIELRVSLVLLLLLLMLLLIVVWIRSRKLGGDEGYKGGEHGALLTVFLVSRKSLILMCVMAVGSLGFSSTFLGRAMSLVSLRVVGGVGG